MNTRSFSHLDNGALLRRLAAEVGQDRATTATLLALIAEVDARRLFAEEGFPSMFAYCVQVLHMSDDVAFKRIRAARSARQFPAIFDAVADGRLHLTAVVFLAPHLTPGNADELMAASTHKTKAEIEWLLAERFPQPDLPERIGVLSASPALTLSAEQDSGHVQELPRSLVPEPVACAAPRPKLTPLSAERFGLQFSIERGTREKLRYAQALLGHRLPAGEIATVFDLALDALIEQLEKTKFAATSRPRSGRQGSSSDPRHIPAHVKRAVWEREGGQCGFVSESGQRCPARSRLEYDHIDPVARGGEATVDGIRIRCRTHNQYEAECVFGAGFMSEKREMAMRAAAGRREEREREAAAQRAERERVAAERLAEREAKARAAAADPEKDVTPWLRRLGYRADEARRTAALCDSLPTETSLEDRIRFALRQLMPPHQRGGPGLAAAS